MTPSELLLDAYGRLPDLVHAAVDGLTVDQLQARVDAQANTIGWLVWHLARVQDEHVARAFDVEQLWTSDGWADRLELPFEPDDIGYGHTPEQVAAVRVGDVGLLTQYADAVVARSLELLRAVTAADLDRVVDRSWDPPVTLGVRLVSVLDDDLQHVGQAAFLRGLLERAGT
jgi:uncharacterized damage-inducible protein DinB